MEHHIHRVLLAWHRDAEFLTPEGQPRPLPREGEHSFHTLIRKHAGDVPRHAMLKELLDSKAIEERADGMLVPKRRSMQQAGTDANNLLEIGRRLHLVSEAIVATLDNVRRNDVADIIEVTTAAVHELQPTSFDLVVANIGAATLRSLAPALVDLLTSTGVLVLSGVLAEQFDEVELAFVRAGTPIRDVRISGDWRTLVCESA